MCGIIGIATTQKLEIKEILEQGIEKMGHRGPDGTGFFIDQQKGSKIGLGHSRFAIIDLSEKARQPMANEDGSVQIVFSGEIYNFQEIKAGLEQKNHIFKSLSDTEVLVHLWEEKGIKMLDYVRGMFSFGLWDRKKNQLFLARDQLGIKPLYYFWNGSTLVFASEIRSIAHSGLVKPKISQEAMVFYLKFGFIPAPLTIFEQIKSLEPGHFLLFEKGRLKKEKYFDLFSSFKKEKIRIEKKEAVSLLREKLKESLKMHLTSDVPLGFFLSGGIDSSSLVSLASKILLKRARTFSLIFPNTSYDESQFSKAVAQKFQTVHSEIEILSKDLEPLLEEFFEAMDQPSVDGFNTFLVSRSAKLAGLKVCISGLGGDELFGGYATFWKTPLLFKGFGLLKFLSSFPLIPKLLFRAKAARIKEALCNPCFENAYFCVRTIFSSEEISKLFKREIELFTPFSFLTNSSQIKNEKERISFLELSFYLAGQLLPDSDVFGMAHPVEIRTPFVDRELVSFLGTISPKYKYEVRPNKAFLIRMVGNLPSETYNRKKQGFNLPLSSWMKKEMASIIKETLKKQDFLEKNFVQKLSQGFYNNSVPWSKVWSVFVLAKWLNERK